MKRLIKHFKRWNKWRKRNTNSRFYKLLVLLGICKSPTLAYTLTDKEEREFHRALIGSLEYKQH